jgi:hypothetical protein
VADSAAKVVTIALWFSRWMASVDADRYDVSGPGTFLLGWCEVGSGEWRRVRYQFCQAPQVLGDCRQRELVLCAARPS